MSEDYKLADISTLNDWLAWWQRPFTKLPLLKLQKWGYGKEQGFGRAKHTPKYAWAGWTWWFWYRVMRTVVGFRIADKSANWWARKWQRTFRLTIADHGELYYVNEFAYMHSHWMGMATHTDFPPPEHDPDRHVHKHMGGGIRFDGDKYWRATLPFSMWKVRTRQNKVEYVPRSDQRVQDYIALERAHGR